MKVRLAFVANSSSSDYVTYTPFRGHTAETVDLRNVLAEAGYNVKLAEESNAIRTYKDCEGRGLIYWMTLKIDAKHNVVCYRGPRKVEINLADPSSMPILLAWLDAEEG